MDQRGCVDRKGILHRSKEVDDVLVQGLKPLDVLTTRVPLAG